MSDAHEGWPERAQRLEKSNEELWDRIWAQRRSRTRWVNLWAITFFAFVVAACVAVIEAIT
jgi:hypothetical protein